ncbi:MAG TPA: aldo/keto reductase, partial [Candidatus Acidoferrales bacterium]|nr:aldo/keto reductase [Candidatus Acidoferrales bacterium]
NQTKAIKLIRYAIDQGVNYIDTAYTYHDGQSEIVVGKALQDGYRKKVKVATKMPVFSLEKKTDLDYIFKKQLQRLNTECIDFYLLHALMADSWKKVQDLYILDWAEHQIAEGKIGQLGFSFHDEYKVFREIIDGYNNWAFCQIQYNYLDEHYQAGKIGLHYAAQKGLAVIVMEPLAGGLLAVKPPLEIQREWDKTGIKRAPADWGLQWVWNHPEISSVLSGMNSIAQLRDNLASADNSGPNTLTGAELAALARSRELFQNCGYIGCSKCHYCNKCPQSIDISLNLAFLNQYASKRRYPRVQERIKKKYAQEIPVEQRANSCIRCGQCENLCPQHLPVRRLLAEAAENLQ